MVDRHWIGDLARATLLALPLAMLAWPAAATIATSANSQGVQVATARAAPASGRMSVLG